MRKMLIQTVALSHEMVRQTPNGKGGIPLGLVRMDRYRTFAEPPVAHFLTRGEP